MKDNFLRIIKFIIEYGLYSLAFILPIQTRWIIKAGELNGGYWEYGTISLYFTDLLLIFILFIFLVFKFKNSNPEYSGQFQIKSKAQSPKSELKVFNVVAAHPSISGPRMIVPFYWWIVAGLELAVFISIFFAPDKGLAFFYYLRFLLGIGLFWLIVSADYNKIKFIFSLISGIFFQASLGIFQFLTQSTFANKWLGIALHNPSDLGVSVVETLSGGRWLRAYGGLDHPNMLGGVLVVGLLFIIFFITQLYSKKTFINIDKKNLAVIIIKMSIKIFILYSFFLIFLAALFFTFSRGAWAGFITGLLIMLMLAIIKKDLWKQIYLLKIILAGGVLIFILFNLFSDLTLTRISPDTRLEAKSNSERIESYKVAREIIKNHWLFGVGIGNYTLAVHDEINNSQPSWAYQPAHNVFLLIWAEIGLFGFLFFILLIVYIIIFNFQPAWPASRFPISNKMLNFQSFIKKLGIRNYNLEISKDFNNYFKIKYLHFSIAASLLVMFLVDHWFFSLHFGVLFLWLILGLIFRENKVEI